MGFDIASNGSFDGLVSAGLAAMAGVAEPEGGGTGVAGSEGVAGTEARVLSLRFTGARAAAAKFRGWGA